MDRKKWYEENKRWMGLVYIIWGAWCLFSAFLVAAGIFHYSLFAQVVDGLVVGTLLIGVGLGKL